MTDYWWESDPSASLGMTPCEVIGRARKDAPARTAEFTKCPHFRQKHKTQPTLAGGFLSLKLTPA